MKFLNGYIIKNNLNKTIKVNIQKIKKHRLYKKYIKKIITLQVHDENNIGKIGDKVLITMCRPISKNKSWKLIKIIK